MSVYVVKYLNLWNRMVANGSGGFIKYQLPLRKSSQLENSQS